MAVLTKADRLSAAMRLSSLVRADDDASLARFAKTQLPDDGRAIDDLRLARDMVEQVALLIASGDRDGFARLAAAYALLTAPIAEDDPDTEVPTIPPAGDGPVAPIAPPVAPSPWVEPSAAPRAYPPAVTAPVAYPPDTIAAAHPPPMRIDPDGATIDASATAPSPVLPFQSGDGAPRPAPVVPPLKISPDGHTLMSEQGPTGPALPFKDADESS